MSVEILVSLGRRRAKQSEIDRKKSQNHHLSKSVVLRDKTTTTRTGNSITTVSANAGEMCAATMGKYLAIPEGVSPKTNIQPTITKNNASRTRFHAVHFSGLVVFTYR